jgi:hypothetical protein
MSHAGSRMHAKDLSSTVLVALALAGCGGGGPHAAGALTVGESVLVEGTVTKIDVTPMFVDGDGLIFVKSAVHGAVIVQIPARERICRAQGLGALSALAPGYRVRALGSVTGPRNVTVCALESHFLERL